MRPPPADRSAYRLFRRMDTRWFDNDVYGHMNNAQHYQMFDTAVNAHLVEAGVLDPLAGATIFLVAESGCRYHAPLAFPQTIAAGLRVSRLGRSSVEYRIGLFAAGADTAAAEGHFVHVNVDRETGQAVPIPPETRAVFEPLQ